ncbi:MAG TPA: amino acid adenylation domain-containing protein [Blastocatellia bacterium]|nr:amino acid adenylation domain-containing protein [Blastocatellia bacterium]
MQGREHVIEGFRLSPQQRQIWLLQRNSPAYQAQCAILIEGSLDAGAFGRALNKIVEQHEILRTSLDWFPGLDTPIQIVVENQPPLYREVDLRGREPEAALAELLEAEARPFTLKRGQLGRYCLARVGASKWVFLICLHALCADSRTLQNLFKKISRSYLAELEGEEPAEEPVQYLQFSEWQHEMLKELNEEEAAPSQELTAGGDLPLPFERRSSRGSEFPPPDFSPGSITRSLDSAVTARIEAINHSAEASISGLLFTCWQILLWRLSGVTDTVINYSFDGRPFQDLHEALGLFAWPMPARGVLGPGITVGEALKRALKSRQQSMAMQERSLRGLADQEAEESSRAIGFEYEEWPGSEQAGGVTFSYWKQACRIDRFKLKLSGSRTETGLTIEIHYDQSIFAPESIELLGERYLTLLKNAASNPQTPIDELELIGPKERTRLLEDWNQTEPQLLESRYIHDLIEEQARSRPDSIAVTCRDEQLSFEELVHGSGRLANYLRSLGVGPDSVVGLYLERSTEMVIGWLAILKSGGAYLPLQIGDPVKRLGEMLEDAKAGVVITKQALAGELSGLKLNLVTMDGDREQIAGFSPSTGDVALTPQNLAYVIYTSGSTGRPKGVMVRHSSMHNLFDWLGEAVYRAHGEGLTVGLNASLTFDASVKQIIQLGRGSRLCLIPEEERLNEQAMLQYLKQHGIEVLDCTPSQLRVLMDAGLDQEARRLGIVLVGGEAIDARSWDEMSAKAGIRFYNVYGPTECTVDAAACQVGAEEESTLGRPILNARIYLVDHRGGLAPIGVTGEIYIGGAGVARGYLSEARLTAVKFAPDPFGNRAGERLYRTGDLGRSLPDGRIMYEGRMDHQVKIRGHRIELGEIEAVLRSHPGVRETAAIVREDEPGQQRIVGYVTGKPEWMGAGRPRRKLPNGMAIAEQNRNETEYLYEEIFVKKSYLKHGITLPKSGCIFDVGANIGMFTLFACRNRKGVRVYAFEPIEPIYEVLQINTQLYGDGRVKLYQMGLGAREKRESYTYYRGYSMMSGESRYAAPAEDLEVIKNYLRNENGSEPIEDFLREAEAILTNRFEEERYECQVRTLAEVIREEGVERIDLLKVDVQRAEIDVLRGIEEQDWARIDQIVMEVHDQPGGETEGHLGEIERMLQANGYQVVIEQDELLSGTDRYNLYARRGGLAEQTEDPDEAEIGIDQSRAEFGKEELKRYVKERVPDYMVPAAIVILDQLPQTRNGKVDRSALPRPEEVDQATEAEEHEHRNPYEELLSGIWKEVLKVTRVRSGDNFFEIGGHSLLATQVVSRIRATFGIEIGVRSIFEDATVAGLARRIEEAMKAGAQQEAPPLTRVPRNGRLPLSFAQQRLWFLDQLVPNNPFYNCPGAVRFEGRLDLQVFERVINEILRRHEVLRTRIEVEDGAPWQVIEDWRGQQLSVVDLRSLAAEERAAATQRIAGEESETGFDLRRGPLVRVKVLRLGEEEHAVFFTMHHIVSDGWSMGVLVREVCALYAAMSEGGVSPLPELEIQYADYAVWQRQYLTGGRLNREVEYWKGRLDGAAMLELPTDYPRPASLNHRGGVERIELGIELSEGLKRLAQREGSTLFMVLMAAFKVMLMRYGGEEDLSVGTAIANRTRSEIEGLIGFFINTLVMRTDLSGNPSFKELLGREREVALGAYAHQEVPFEKLVEEINPERDLSRSPLFQVMLVLQNAGRETLEIRGLKIRGIGEEIGDAKFDLTLSLLEGRDRIYGGMGYRTDLYQAETIRRIARHFERLLEEVVRDVNQQIRQIQLLSEAEKSQILEGWNETERVLPETRLVHEMIRERALEKADAIAVKSEQGALSYGELNRQADRLRGSLRRRGVGREEMVGICMGRSAEMVIAMLGVLKAGAAYTPIDGSYPEERIRYILENAGVKVILTDEVSGRWLEEAGPIAETIKIESLREEPDGKSDDPPEVKVEGENLAYVIYTSGSTGRPKGVQVTHRGLANSTVARFHYYSERPSSFLLMSSFGFDSSVAGIYWSLCQGGTLVLPPEKLERDPRQVARLMTESQTTHVLCLPALYSALLTESGSMRMEALKCVIVAGEACPAEVLERHSARLGGAGLFNEYGPTEGTVWSSVYGDCAKSPRVPVPIGRPISNVQMYILDRELEPVPIGAKGEIYISGGGLARGYLGRPDLTAERFIPNHFGRVEGAKLYRTGDLGRYLPDGNIEFSGRADDQVKIRGYRIELGEIEAVLNEHRAVRQGVVLAVGDESEGGRLAAYVVGSGNVTEAEIKRDLGTRLPGYMIPETVLMLDQMPLTANGKVDRHKLLLLKAAGRSRARDYQAPQTPAEEILAGIFSEVLRLDRTGRDDNFFEIGGHSLLAIRVISRVREAFGVELGVRSLFEHPTIQALARSIEDELRAGSRQSTPPLTRVSRDERLPLSFAQQRLWFIHQLEPGTALYNCPVAVRMIGKLNLGALNLAINEIVRRHEVLRTRIEEAAGEPVQIIDEWADRSLPVNDLTDCLTREEREAAASRILSTEARTGFDLSKGPLIRVKVLRLSEDEHALALTMHHLVSDGWSMEILVNELRALYHSYDAGGGSPLAELPIQYADFAIWQREYLSGKVLESQIEYWKRQLQGAPRLELPSDRARPARPSYRGGRERVEIGQTERNELRRLGQQGGATLFMVLMAAFKVLLMKYSGEEDLSIGTAVANRTRKELEAMIGFFVNTLVMRTNLSGNPGFRELVERERRVALEAYTHQEVPFEKLVEEINPERDLGWNPLFQVMMVLQNTRREALEIGGLKIAGVGEQIGVAKFDLTLTLTEGDEGISGHLEYSRDLYEAETISRMVRHYERVVAEIARDAAQGIRDLNLMTPDEREQILIGWNETEMATAETRPVPLMIAEQARRRPEGIAIECDGERISYRELNEKANQLAHHLRELGCGPETKVGICLDRSIGLVVGLLGVLKTGAAYIPMDPIYPDSRLNAIIEDAAIQLLLTEKQLAGRCSAPSTKVICLDEDWVTISTRSSSDLQTWIDPDHAAYVIYTSGSTGTPKGVMVSHRSVSNLFKAADDHLHLNEEDVWTAFHSVAFDFSVWEIWGALSYGGTLVIVPYLMARTPEAFHELVRRQGVTVLSQTPSAFRHFARVDEGAAGVGALCLRAVIFGGEALEFQHLKGWLERHGDEAPQLINMYGITETTVHTTYRRVTSADLRDDVGSLIGWPLANIRRYVLDDRMEPVPPGVVGELYVGGGGVARGYLGREDLTAERFVPAGHDRERGERMYRTGDLARYLGDGDLQYLGRRDHQVKIRGFRIELGEIESVLLHHEAVREAVVIVREGAGGDRSLAAFLTETGGRTLTTGELRTYLKQRLPDYMVPATFVTMEKLPQTPNGKLDRQALRIPEEARGEGQAVEAGPRTPVEEILIGFFEEVLRLGPIGVGDNFFEIGGHSLLATQIISRIRSVFGIEIGVRSIFEEPTVEGLARRIDEIMKDEQVRQVPPLVRRPREGRLPLSFAQQRLWFVEQLDPGSAVYNCPAAVRLKGRLDLAVLESVFNEIVKRHEVLRTRIEVVDRIPVQVIEEWEDRSLSITDLTGWAPAERETEMRRIAGEEARTGFDLKRGPLLRVKVIKLVGEDEHVVLFNMHHIVSDGWSMGVLVREVCALYESMSEGHGSPLPAPELQYGDYAVWQRQYLTGEVLARETGYWKEKLRDAEMLQLPADYSRPAAPSHRGGWERIEIGRGLSEGLAKLGRPEGATLYMVLMAAFKMILMRYSGQIDLSVGTAIANRTRRELEGVIGFFVNTLVMRTDLGGNPTFRELVRREREVALEAYAHQEVPFEKLVEEINPERNLSRSPLFQVKLVLENTGRERLKINGLQVEGIKEETCAAKFDLLMMLTQSEEGIVGRLEYSQDLFQGETVRRMARHYVQALNEVALDADQRIETLELMTEAERTQLLEEWNRSEPEDGRSLLIPELFGAQARSKPDCMAAVCGDQRLSYGALEQRANQLGHHLRNLGMGPESIVGLYLERSVDMLVGLLGILKAGAAYLPLEVGQPAERVGMVLMDSGAGAVVTMREVADSLPIERSRKVLLDEDWGRIAESDSVAPPVSIAPENLAYVIYTSGSTGKPKGVMVHHEGLLNYTHAMCRRLQLDAGNRNGLQFATVSTIAADLGNTCIYPSLVSGGCLQILNYEVATDAARFGEYLEQHPIDVLKIVPTHLNGLLSAPTRGLKMLPEKYLILGGEALPSELVELVRAERGDCEVINHYGPTETTIGSLTMRPGGSGAGKSGTIPIGRPIANTRIYILDRQLKPVPVGVRGELHIAGAGVSRGYLGRPELTAERFIPNPFTDRAGDRSYRTGDLVRYLSDGNVEFGGRNDSQVKIRGYRIELGEIEAVLSEHRAVRQSVVIATGESEKSGTRLAGYIVVEGAQATPAELKSYLRERLPDYMVPATLTVLKEMPITANGKIDRRRLPSLIDPRQSMEAGFVAPRDSLELQLVQIWEQVLGVQPIGVRDNFFELGGHSLLAASLMARIQEALGRELPLSALFQGGTVEYLAAILREEAGSILWSGPVKLQDSGSRRPLFFVHPGGGNVLCYFELARSLGADQPFYAFQSAGLYGEQTPHTSIEEMAAHYLKALRTALPDGPYLLGGWSLGGIVAYEMAQQLIAQGQQVGRLLLLDTSASSIVKDEAEFEEDDAELLRMLLSDPLSISDEELRPIQGENRIRYILRKAIDMRLLPPGIEVAQARSFLAVYRANVKAMLKYVPQPYPGSMTLFKAAIQPAGPAPDESTDRRRKARDRSMGWKRLAGGGVQIIEVPGDHLTMVKKPQVETLARRIAACLDEVKTVGRASRARAPRGGKHEQ